MRKTLSLEVRNANSPAQLLLSKTLYLKEIQTLFKLKSFMIDAKDNFRSSYEENMWCRTCCLFSETKEHLFQCINFSEIKYSMLKANNKHQEMYEDIPLDGENQERYARGNA